MKIQLPKLIEKYIQASNNADKESFISCFSTNAIVFDEGVKVSGHTAIEKWFIRTRNEYKFKTDPIKIKENGDLVVLTAKVSGQFPNSPVTLDYFFKIQSDKIQSLEVQ